MKITYSYRYISCHYHTYYLHSIKMYMSCAKVSIYLFRGKDLIVKFYGLTTNYAKNSILKIKITCSYFHTHLSCLHSLQLSCVNHAYCVGRIFIPKFCGCGYICTRFWLNISLFYRPRASSFGLCTTFNNFATYILYIDNIIARLIINTKRYIWHNIIDIC